MDSINQTPAKLDVYALVTNRIIELLEKGTIPWKQPWMETGIPMNLISKRSYRGITLWLLLSLNYPRNLFLTWDQIKKLGASVKQGEHGHIVVFWRTVEKPGETEGEEPKTSSLLRYYKVFNIEQCRDLPGDLVPETVPAIEDPLKQCEAIVLNMPSCPDIQYLEPHPFYDPFYDRINMPKRRSYKRKEAYYATLFHELVHSTGHENRLNRKSITEMAKFGSELYSIEELIAELGSAFLCSTAGILETEIADTVAYIQGWLSKLRNDKRFIIQASSHAQQAIDFIIAKK